MGYPDRSGRLRGLPMAGAGGMGGGSADRPRYSGLMDMLDGGGAGRSGQRFEGGALSGLLNAVGIRPMGYRDRLAEARPMARPAAPAAPAQPLPVTPAGIETSVLPDPVVPMATAAIERAEAVAQARRMVPSFDRLPVPLQQNILRQVMAGGGVTIMRGR